MKEHLSHPIQESRYLALGQVGACDYGVEQIPAGQDNYLYLLVNSTTQRSVAIDPGWAAPLIEVLHSRHWQLESIWLTHHHSDHQDGVNELVQHDVSLGEVKVAGFHQDRHRLLGLTQELVPGQEFQWQDLLVKFFHWPGHTTGHGAFYLPQLGILFCGDVLFGLGCGRLFEGTPATLFNSFIELKSLPDSTLVFCAHEYTLANARFVLTLPRPPGLETHIEERQALLRLGVPTVPLVLGTEKRLNPFLLAADAQELGRLRQLKNNF